ncbi:unnamed protein product [Adineta steineri]|uniref:Uncharacterized protein n=1 Tax=Adineta steineri TaxID=433720 RepID=A0A819L4L3_9BILA|nr:unnamed protein product [Adineta steineri]
MQSNVGIDKSDTLDGPYMPLSTPLTQTQDFEIQPTRKILFLLNTILIVVAIIDLIVSIQKLTFVNFQGINVVDWHATQTFIWLLLNAFAILVTYKYHQTGLFLFAWMGVIGLVITGIITIIFLYLVVWLYATGRFHTYLTETLMITMLSIVYILFFTIKIIIVQFAFKLARLIHINKQSLINQ